VHVDPHEQNSLYPEPGKLAAYLGDGQHHGYRRLAAVLVLGIRAWPYGPPVALLADPAGNNTWIRSPHSTREDVVTAQGVALNQSPMLSTLAPAFAGGLPIVV
jgi:hypothetical protein